jgi:hypothetical protein
MTSDQLSAGAGIVLSLACSYIPGLREWFAGQDSDRKRLLMLVALLVVTFGAFLLTCAGVLGGTAVQCSQKSAIDLFWAFVAALIANQAAFLISPGRKS